MSKFNYNISQRWCQIIICYPLLFCLIIQRVQLRARGTILHKSCRLQAAATFFFEERYDFGTKIGTEHPDFGTKIGILEIDSS